MILLDKYYGSLGMNGRSTLNLLEFIESSSICP